MRSFIDTNILVYADAGDEPVKQAQAIELIAAHRLQGTGVISTQVLQEYANVAVRKLGMPVALVRDRIDFYAGFDVVPVSPALVGDALLLHAEHGLSFFDALIVQAASAAGCARLLSEDLQTGRRLLGLQIHNPFRASVNEG